MNKGQLGNKGHLVKWQRTCISKEQFDAKDQQLSVTVSTLKTGWQGRQPGPLWMGGRLSNVGGIYDWPTGHFWLPRTIIGEGNGTPLQYSCLENPMDGGAWKAAVHGVSKSRTWLKRLSSSSTAGQLLNGVCWCQGISAHPWPCLLRILILI